MSVSGGSTSGVRPSVIDLAGALSGWFGWRTPGSVAGVSVASTGEPVGCLEVTAHVTSSGNVSIFYTDYRM